MNDDEKRKRLKAHYVECDAVRAERDAIERAEYERFLNSRLPPRRGWSRAPLPSYPLFPEELRGMTCGARTRAGTPCKMTAIHRNGRCKLHGGMSTGPRSNAGKARSAANGLAPKRKRTP
ncbi:HGGxSTG domain-containing protein [Ralstonia sp. 11b]|jgi:hypothetical protein|nr:HGGxSTG domain-containing protein [Ralstonia sp. 11b]MDR9384315.1 HGGxSTG domain-containing protein [Ralstonia sp. 11b]